MRYHTWFLCMAGFLGFFHPFTMVANPMVYIYNAPESVKDKRYEYHWEILREALRKTEKSMGPFLLKSSPAMTELRQEGELRTARGFITVIVRGETTEFMENYIPARIPIDRGLLGYRVFFIRSDRQKDFDAIQNFQQLRSISIGQGSLWKDIKILQHNGFKVVSGNSYDGLFNMLISRRFDAFSRGVEEILDEYDQQGKIFPDLKIENTLLLHYPMARFFWFSKNDEGKKLAERVEKGLSLMIEDGSFNEMFDRFHKAMYDRLNLKERRLFQLENPIGVPQLQTGDPRWWYVPFKK